MRMGTLSPVALTRASLDRARALNPSLNCLLTIVEKEALREAEAAEREIRAGHYRGPLHGIPYTAKDIFDTAGIRTTAASAILRDRVPKMDSTVVRRLREAGAILIGKAHLSEFASGPTNCNEHYGPARNPWNRERIPGGSSGGSAAAVAAGIGCFSIGSDTGGSIRIPAALCGVLGLKPSFGLVSRTGCFPLSWSLDTVGVLTRESADAAAVLAALAGQDGGDPASRDGDTRALTSGLADVAGLRIGLPRELLAQPCDDAVRTAFMAAVAALEKRGARLVDVSASWIMPALAISSFIIAAEALSAHQRWFPAQAASYGSHMQEVLLMGTALSAADYLACLRVRATIVQRTAALFREVDLVATPTVAVLAPPVGSQVVKVTGAEMGVLPALRSFTRWSNLSGCPSVSVPCGMADGLPIGLQLMGRMDGDAVVLCAARAYEAVWPFMDRPLAH